MSVVCGPTAVLPPWPLNCRGLLKRSRDFTCLFLLGDTRASSSVRFFGLHFQNCPKKPVRSDRQEADFCAGVEAVQVGALGGQVVVDVLVVALSAGQARASV